MPQAATADLPPHQGLFNLAAQAKKPAEAPRVEPRLVPVMPPASPAPAAVKPPQARPQLAIAASKPAPAASGGNTQVQPRPQAADPRKLDAMEPMSRGRFLKTIEHLAKTEEAKAVDEIVARVRAREVEQAILHGARARARYLAAVVDLGASRAAVGRTVVAELGELRRAHEELSKGLDALADAIREGLVDVVGVGE